MQKNILLNLRSYYINEIMNIAKYLSFGILIVLIIFIIIKKIQHKNISKKLIVTSIILLIVGIAALFIRMPYVN